MALTRQAVFLQLLHSLLFTNFEVSTKRAGKLDMQFDFVQENGYFGPKMFHVIDTI